MSKKAPKQERIITDDMRASAEVSVKRWNDYVTKWQPTEKKAIADKAGVSDSDFQHKTAALQSQMRGTVNADVAQATSGALKPIAGNPTGSMVKGSMATSDLGKRVAAANVDATASAEDRKAAELGAITGLGQQISTGTLASMSDLASNSAQVAVINARADQAERFANQNATTAMVGAGMNALTTGAMMYKAPSTGALYTGAGAGGAIFHPSNQYYNGSGLT